MYESTITSANAVNPAQTIYSVGVGIVGVGIVMAFSMLDESLQPDTKGISKLRNKSVIIRKTCHFFLVNFSFFTAENKILNGRVFIMYSISVDSDLI